MPGPLIALIPHAISLIASFLPSIIDAFSSKSPEAAAEQIRPEYEALLARLQGSGMNAGEAQKLVDEIMGPKLQEAQQGGSMGPVAATVLSLGAAAGGFKLGKLIPAVKRADAAAKLAAAGGAAAAAKAVPEAPAAVKPAAAAEAPYAYPGQASMESGLARIDKRIAKDKAKKAGPAVLPELPARNPEDLAQKLEAISGPFPGKSAPAVPDVELPQLPRPGGPVPHGQPRQAIGDPEIAGLGMDDPPALDDIHVPEIMPDVSYKHGKRGFLMRDSVPMTEPGSQPLRLTGPRARHPFPHGPRQAADDTAMAQFGMDDPASLEQIHIPEIMPDVSYRHGGRGFTMHDSKPMPGPDGPFPRIGAPKAPAPPRAPAKVLTRDELAALVASKKPKAKPTPVAAPEMDLNQDGLNDDEDELLRMYRDLGVGP